MATTPRDIGNALTVPPVRAESLTPTRSDGASTKATFANALLRFLSEGFKERLFTKALYGRLQMTFGMIAHNDIHGFRAEWFDTAEDRARFVKELLAHPCHGAPTHTYSDVERIIQGRLEASGLQRYLDEASAAAKEAADQATYERLAARFGQQTKAPPRMAAQPATPALDTPPRPKPRRPGTNGQASLFDA